MTIKEVFYSTQNKLHKCNCSSSLWKTDTSWFLFWTSSGNKHPLCKTDSETLCKASFSSQKSIFLIRVFSTCSQAAVQTDRLSDRQTTYRQSEHMCKSATMLIFYFPHSGLLAWQKGNKNYLIKQLSFQIQIWLRQHKARCIILLSNPPMEYSYWKCLREK